MMIHVKTVYTGYITHRGSVVFVSTRGSRKELHHELNWWMFDYHYAQGLSFVRIPPLDDWTQSDENPAIWTIQFPTPDWIIRTQEDMLTF